MILTKFLPGQTAVIAYGLWQYDYGQTLQVEGLSLPGPAEVHFSKLDRPCAGVVKRRGAFKDGILSVDIPDEFIWAGASFVGYICAVGDEIGETVGTVYFPVLRRSAPDSRPAFLKDLIEQVQRKADNISLSSDGYMQLLSGEIPIGTRIRLPEMSSGEAGREVELKNDGTSICWRYTNSNEWFTLVSLADLRGKDGVTPEMEIREGHLFAIYND